MSNAVALAITLVERQKDVAAQALALALQKQRGAQAQLEQLEAYARETDNKWINRTTGAATPELMQHHYQFMAKLDQAIQFQLQVIQNHVGIVAKARSGLMAVEQRLAQFTHMRAAQQATAALAQSRREQKQMDELASRMGRHRMRRLDAEESS